jgi:hypothetical protein
VEKKDEVKVNKIFEKKIIGQRFRVKTLKKCFG